MLQQYFKSDISLSERLAIGFRGTFIIDGYVISSSQMKVLRKMLFDDFKVEMLLVENCVYVVQLMPF